MREESDRHARELAATSNQLILTISSGIDSQSVLHSFATQGIPIETAFMYLPGYNDHEYRNLQIIDKKYGIKTQIIDIDPKAIADELIAEDNATGIHRFFLLSKRFISLLPDSADVLQIIHDPQVLVNNGVPYYHMGLHYCEIEKPNAFALANRSGKNLFFGDTSEFMYSFLNDPVYRAVATAGECYNTNGLSKKLFNVYRGDNWDFYVKPFIYGQYWKDELIYFPKYNGSERMPFIRRPFDTVTHSLAIPFKELLSHLGNIGADTRRYYESDQHSTNA
jgi:hypothetical protein